MRKVLLICLMLVALTGAFSDQGLSHPNCSQINSTFFCGGVPGCTGWIEWSGTCAGDNLKEWRCCWFGDECPPCHRWDSCWCEGGGCDCLPAGTPIALADGSTKPVEKIQVGDQVLAYDIRSAGMTHAEVLAVHAPHIAKHYFVVNETVSMTENHPVLSAAWWVAASQLSVGDLLTGPGGVPVPVRSIQRIDREVLVYNFQVSSGTYIAGGVIMHNKEECEEYIQYP